MRGIAAAGMLVALVVSLAAEEPEPRFDVVSVKRNTTGATASSLRPEPNGITGTNVTAMRLFRVAYQAATFQVADAPGWFDAERFDVAAKATGRATPAELSRMIRGLLADRFGLRVETARREVSGYELRQERMPNDGLTVAERPCRLAHPTQPLPPPSASRPPACFSATDGELSAHGVTMTMVAQELTGFTQQPVVDRTGLSGVYDFDLRWSLAGPAAAANADAPPLVTAVREQLGLRLVPAKVEIDAYVITAAHRPDGN